jgi:glycosyltransferase involved in cell wall biosynthesis
MGELIPETGLKEAIWTFDILRYVAPRAKLCIVGEGPERESLLRFARSLKVDAHVHFLERTSASACYRRADVVWVPSQTPGQYEATLRAMSYGKAVMTAATPGLADDLVHGTHGLLYEPGNKPALAQGTARLLSDPDLRLRLGQAAREKTLTQFSADDMIRRHLVVYDSLK